MSKWPITDLWYKSCVSSPVLLNLSTVTVSALINITFVLMVTSSCIQKWSLVFHKACKRYMKSFQAGHLSQSFTHLPLNQYAFHFNSLLQSIVSCFTVDMDFHQDMYYQICLDVLQVLHPCRHSSDKTIAAQLVLVLKVVLIIKGWILKRNGEVKCIVLSLRGAMAIFPPSLTWAIIANGHIRSHQNCQMLDFSLGFSVYVKHIGLNIIWGFFFKIYKIFLQIHIIWLKEWHVFLTLKSIFSMLLTRLRKETAHCFKLHYIWLK